MPITVRCQCGKQYRVKDELAGKVVMCAACKAKLRVPNEAVASTPPAVASTKAAVSSAKAGNPPTRLILIACLAIALIGIVSVGAVGAYFLFFRDIDPVTPVAQNSAPPLKVAVESKPQPSEPPPPKGRPPLCTIQVPSGEILHFAVNWRTQTSYRVITADSANNVMVWDDTGKQLGVFKGHNAATRITAISFARDGSLVASAALVSKDGEPAAQIIVWETDTTYVVREFTGYFAALERKPLPQVTALGLTATANVREYLGVRPLESPHWLIAGVEGGLWVWDVSSGEEVCGFTTRDNAQVTHIAGMVAGRDDNLAILWNTRALSQGVFISGTSAKSLNRDDGFILCESHQSPIRSTTVMGDDGVATADDSGRVIVWDNMGYIRYELPGAGPLVTGGFHVVTIGRPGEDGQILVQRWSDREKELLHTIDHVYDKDADMIVASRDGGRLATRSSTRKNELRLWNTEYKKD